MLFMMSSRNSSSSRRMVWNWATLEGKLSPIPNNLEGSLHRLHTLVWKMRKSDLLDEYDTVIREQLEEGVVE